MIDWVLFMPTSIANACANDTRKTPKLGIRTPESTQGKSSRLRFRWHRQINSRLAHCHLSHRAIAAIAAVTVIRLRFTLSPVKKHDMLHLLVSVIRYAPMMTEKSYKRVINTL